MNFDKVKHIIEVIKNSDITELDYEKSGRKIYLKKGIAAQKPAEKKEKEQETHPEGNENSKGGRGRSLYIVKSRYVGTAHLISPDRQREYIRLNENVKKGDKICVIEAMKILKEVIAVEPGKVIKILVSDGVPVQYGQEMFWIETQE